MYTYFLSNNQNNENEQYKFITKKFCHIIIDYGNKQQEITMDKFDEIKWNNNVIITYKNNKGNYIDSYKLCVDSEYLKIYCYDQDSIELKKYYI
tara:strand:- start:1230 stop:1511 length:282 start_codon:yes stop_codon:yes gene_type:complete